MIEFRNNSVDDGRWDKADEEGGEHAVLEVEDGIAEGIEGEAVEDACDDGDEQFTIVVGGIPPVLGEHSSGERGSLEPDRGSIFVLDGFFRREFGSLGFDAVDFCKKIFVFLRLPPLLVPVQSFTVRTLASFDGGFEDELGNVLLRWTYYAPLREVPVYCCAIVTNGTEVESVPAWVQGEDHVELLDQKRRRLMNSTDQAVTSMS